MELITYTNYYRPLLVESLSDKYIKRYTNKGYYRILSLLHLFRSDFYMFRIDDKIVGHIVIRTRVPQSFMNGVWIYGVYIFNEYRKKGYGTELMKCAIEQSKAKSIFLKVDKENAIAMNLYKGIGFYSIKQRGNAIIMRYDKI